MTIAAPQFLRLTPWVVTLVWLGSACLTAMGDQENKYASIDALFVEHCLDCHSHDDPDAGLNLETHSTLLRGGQNGSPIIEGDSKRSPLVRLLVGFTDPNGKKRIMPPGRRDKLTPEQIDLVRSWIDQGAPAPPQGWRRTLELNIPQITPTSPAADPVQTLAYSQSGNRLAVGRYTKVELYDPETQTQLSTLDGHSGTVNGLAFSADGRFLYAAAGEAGLFGEIKKWDLTSGEATQTMRGHHDSIYALALSHDGQFLASGSYDQTILLWNASDGTQVREFTGHQGAVFDLAFRPDNRILASASADRTIKLWDVTTGERTDTLAQPLKEQHTVTFSPDGKRLFAAGVDNRIRIWEISDSAKETTNTILKTHFAHEGTILNLVFAADGQTLASAADDRTIKLWDPEKLTERLLLPEQPDWSPALQFVAQDKHLAVGRLDGSLSFYQAKDGQTVTIPKPELTRVIPAGMQRGQTTKIRLEGKRLHNIESVEFNSPDIHAAITPQQSPSGSHLELLVFSAADTQLGQLSLTVKNAQGESNKRNFHIDTLPQWVSPDSTQEAIALSEFPLNVWGRLGARGETDTFRFHAAAGQSLVFDVAANRLGSKADLLLTVSSLDGTLLASSQSFDGSADPLLFHRFETAGDYLLQLSDQFLNASPDHFYRVSVGEFPYVTDSLPRHAPANQETEIQLIGYNLEGNDRLSVTAQASGTQTIDLDAEVFRFRKRPTLRTTAWAAAAEAEPNDRLQDATPIKVGSSAAAQIWQPGTHDVDYFRFSATEGRQLVIETFANEIGSPVDTRIEILTIEGQPIQRLLLEAVRETAITFRPITSTAGGVRLENWEEMSLNDYLYMNGEVVKLFLAPRGPDSSWDFYPAQGTRRTYFDTSATAHANFEPCYIVRAHPPGASLVSNGLPRFPVFYENDDHSEASKRRDSRLYFTAPYTGDFLVRVTDTRGLSSPRFVYQLALRDRKPDFDVTLSNRNPSINRGSGQRFNVSRTRLDGYDGEIEVEFSGLPEGVHVSSPIRIEAGHNQATGTLFIDESVSTLTPWDSLQIEAVATAIVDGETRIRQIDNFGKIKVVDSPQLFVELSPIAPAASATTTALGVVDTNGSDSNSDDASIEIITIEAGTTISAQLNVQRNGHKERITFSIGNLPHGIIVDNIGLNGVLMPPDVSEREIFLTAAPWVEETERLCFARANEAGGQTSRPVLLRVVRPKAQP